MSYIYDIIFPVHQPTRHRFWLPDSQPEALYAHLGAMGDSKTIGFSETPVLQVLLLMEKILQQICSCPIIYRVLYIRGGG